MNWKTEAVDKLKKYEAMKMAKNNLSAEISMLERERGRLNSRLTDLPLIDHTSGHHETAIMDNIVLREELAAQKEYVENWLRIVEKGLQELTPEENLILSKMYICREKNANVYLEDTLGYEQSSIYRHRDIALKKFTLAMYGAE